jgi:hypothetical protein
LWLFLDFEVCLDPKNKSNKQLSELHHFDVVVVVVVVVVVEVYEVEDMKLKMMIISLFLTLYMNLLG